LLNDIFSEFDNAAERHGVEKIKTIGDAYMAAGGLTHSDGQYVDAMAEMAFEMQRYVSRYTAPNGERLSLRIGMATGPVVAGVIGRRKFSYDLWGDTVNIASRMCSEAMAGHIQVDIVTYRRLHNRFRFDEVQQIQVKGKGPMQVYNLLERLTPQDGSNVVSISDNHDIKSRLR
jgi:adenylate cyclase